MPQKIKKPPGQTTRERLPAIDPRLWAPSKLVALYEKHRTHPDLPQQNIDRDLYFSTLCELICNPRMESVWHSLQSSETPSIFPNLLFLAVFRGLSGPSPEWVGLTPKNRQRKLVLIEKRARELRQLIRNTPLQDLDPEVLDALGLDVPNIRYLRSEESDLEIILASLESKTADLKVESPLLKQTKGDYPRRLLLFVKLHELLERYSCNDPYEHIATIASVVLIGDDPDETIDAETVRKAITHRRRDRAESKSTSTRDFGA